MCRPFVFIVFQVLLLQYCTSYPSQEYIIAYIPVEESTYLSPQNIEAFATPYYSNTFFYDPWYYHNMMMHYARFPFRQTTEPVTFGGKVKAKGAVKIMGKFGNQGHGTVTSYSAPPTPLTVTPEPALPASNLSTATSLPYNTILPTTTTSANTTTLPNITTLPEVSLPSTTITHTFTDPMASPVSVPDTPSSFITVTTTVPTDAILNDEVASPIKFSGKVPVSGRVRISAHFC